MIVGNFLILKSFAKSFLSSEINANLNLFLYSLVKALKRGGTFDFLLNKITLLISFSSDAWNFSSFFYESI